MNTPYYNSLCDLVDEYIAHAEHYIVRDVFQSFRDKLTQINGSLIYQWSDVQESFKTIGGKTKEQTPNDEAIYWF